MPLYEYVCAEPVCKAWRIKTEVLQKISDPAPKCELCDIDMRKAVVLTGGFRLTGQGWYQTDFKNK